MHTDSLFLHERSTLSRPFQASARAHKVWICGSTIVAGYANCFKDTHGDLENTCHLLSAPGLSSCLGSYHVFLGEDMRWKWPVWGGLSSHMLDLILVQLAFKTIEFQVSSVPRLVD